VIYQEQLARVRRWLTRVENSSVNPRLELPPKKQTEYEDMLFAFFQNSWHLKDWIKNDAAAPRTLAQPIEQLCAQYPSLQMCADVANGTKHLRLKPSSSRVGGKVVPEIMVRLTDSFVTGESTSQVRYAYKITDDAGNSFDALTVARGAIRDWQTLITSNGEQSKPPCRPSRAASGGILLPTEPLIQKLDGGYESLPDFLCL
jgi:hypothetical protein